MTGSITRQDVMPITITKQRPDKYRMDFSVQDVPAIQSYNGTAAWQTMPWTGNMAPQMVPEARIGDFKNRADFEGPLVNWKERGFVIEMVGIDTVNDVETYNLKLTRPDGNKEYFFIGTSDYLLHMQRNYRKGRDGSDVEVNVFLSDYREVNGVKFAFHTQSTMGGYPFSEIEYESIIVDSKVDEKIFDFPDQK